MLCVIDIYSKYAWVIHLIDKESITITNAFQNILDELKRKPSKIWVDKMHNDRKSVIAEKFISTLKNKIYKYMTSISRNVYTDKLDDMVNKYNNTNHITIKMRPVDVKSNIYVDSSKEINDRDPKFKIGDIVRISKYKNIFAKGYVPN